MLVERVNATSATEIPQFDLVRGVGNKSNEKSARKKKKKGIKTTN